MSEDLGQALREPDGREPGRKATVPGTEMNE